MNLTVNLTVKMFSVFCFGILPSDGPPGCAKAYESCGFATPEFRTREITEFNVAAILGFK